MSCLKRQVLLNIITVVHLDVSFLVNLVRVEALAEDRCSRTTSHPPPVYPGPLVVGEAVYHYVSEIDVRSVCFDFLSEKLLLRNVKVDLHLSIIQPYCTVRLST